MDENHSDAKGILRKRILEEKRSPAQPEDTNVPLDVTQNLVNPDNTLSESNISYNATNMPYEDGSDSSFPLFLSFKANDSMQTVSEGVREKYSNHTDNSTNDPADLNNASMQYENQIQEDELSLQSGKKTNQFDMKYSESEAPIFKPYFSSYKESQEPTYDIPKVFSDQDDRSSISSSQTSNKSVSAAPAMRPGTRYTAAQPMGNIAPLTQQEIKVKRPKTHSRKPLLILLLCISVLIAIFSFWNNFDVEHTLSSLFGTSSETKSTSSISTSDPTVAETTAAATEETIEETSAVTKKPSPTSAPTPTKETTALETTAAETTAASTTKSITPAMTPSGFSTSITGGKSEGDVASFNILFKNQGGNDVSLFDGVEYITITFATSNLKIFEVTSNDFTFAADSNKSNTFIGTPVSTEVIANTDTKTAAISAKSDGTSIGKYTIKYFVKCYN